MSNPVTLDLVTLGPVVPPPDFLIAGPGGVQHTDIVKVRVDASTELKRGTLLMVSEIAAERVFVPCTVDGLAEVDNTFGILADTMLIPANEHADIAAYFEGDFNEHAVIFPWATEADDHAEQVEIAREALRRQKIFLRKSNKW